MKLFNLSPAAARAFSSWNASQPAPAPSYNVRTCSGLSGTYESATGAFKALHFLPARERETACIYDEDGYCMYR